MSTAMEVDKVVDTAELDKLVAGLDHNSTSAITALTKQVQRIRKDLTKDVLIKALQTHTPKSSSILAALEGKKIASIEDAEPAVLQTFFGLLAQVYLLDSEQFESGYALSQALVKSLKTLNSRKLDAVAARIYFYYALFAERLRCEQDIRATLLACQRTATLRHDNLSLATLITLLLRNHLLVNDVPGADKLLAKTTFPATAPNATIARYLYYVARVRAIQLDYTSANEHLTNAIRKIDASPATAGFLQAVYKLNIVVLLLTGEIPEKSALKGKFIERPLGPYAELVNAVRQGDLSHFRSVVEAHSSQFKKDGTLTLVSRLRNNVLKTGIRSISLSYSRMSLKDICLKLGLESEESAEYIISKAIHENIISAKLNHESAELLSSAAIDVYASDVPQKEFHDRIKFCLELRNGSVKAMRFPEDTGRKAINEIEEERRRIEESLLAEDDDVDEL